MDPHASKVVTQKVVQGISRQERETVGDPVYFVGVVVKVRLRPLPEIADRLSPLFVGSRPDAEADAIESVRRVLLEDESVVHAVWLASAGADFDIMGETSLVSVSNELAVRVDITK
jgi:hypothetical protein